MAFEAMKRVGVPEDQIRRLRESGITEEEVTSLDMMADLATSLKMGQIPESMIDLMYPDREEHDMRIRQDKRLLEGVAEEGIVPCIDCGSKSVTTQRVQLRSGDEAMNAIFTCTECGRRWKG